MSGALVAGLDAGLIYNSFPYMGTGLVPPEIFDLTPAWKNFFENDGRARQQPTSQYNKKFSYGTIRSQISWDNYTDFHYCFVCIRTQNASSTKSSLGAHLLVRY